MAAGVSSDGALRPRPRHERLAVAVACDATAIERDHAVGAGQAALETMLGEHDRRLPLLVEPAQQADQLVAGDRVQLRGRLVQQHDARSARERCAQRHALLLSAGQLVRGAIEQRVDAERQRHLLDPARDRRRALAAALERKRQLRAYGARDELRLGVLEQHARNGAEPGRPVLARVEPGQPHAPGEAPAVKVRHEPARGAQQRGLAAAGQARQHAELAMRDFEADIAQRRLRELRIAVGDALEGQQRAAHRSIPRRSQNGSSAEASSARASTSVPASVVIAMRG